MLLMSVVSVMAEESFEEFYGLTTKPSYTGAHFTITAQDPLGYDKYGLFIHNGNKITIKSRRGEKITRVEFHFGDGEWFASHLEANHGTPSVINNVRDGSINDVNATSLIISSDVVSDEEYFQIDKFVVYYESENGGNSSVEPDPTISQEFVLTETFPTSGDSYYGDNIKVETYSDSNRLYIGNGKTVTISPDNDMDVRILKVELELYSEISSVISATGSGKNWTISNIYLPSLPIKSPDDNEVEIKSIKVHYVKMSEEISVPIATNDDRKEYFEGNITVVGTNSSGEYGLDIDKGNSVTIISNCGALISEVKLHLSNRYFDYGKKITSTLADGTPVELTGSDKDWTISNINSWSVTTSLTVSHDGTNDDLAVQIDKITVYYKEPVAPTEIELAAVFAEQSYWTTFYSNACNYQAPEGTEVYKVNLSGSTITMNKIDDGIVTKGQGVVLKSPNSDKITLTKVANESSDDYYGNSLKGTSATIDNPGNAYVLNYKESKGLAFYKLSRNGTIRANRAYLPVTPGSNAAAQAFFAFDTATTTGVDSINAQDSSEQEEKIYDLQGRRVAKPAKGLYIVNGKKVIMK